MSNTNPASYGRHSGNAKQYFGLHTDQPYVPQPYRRPWEQPPRQWEGFPQHGASSSSLPGAEPVHGDDCLLPYGDTVVPTLHWDQRTSEPERQWDRPRQSPSDQSPVEHGHSAFSAAAGSGPRAPCPRTVPAAPALPYQPDYDGSIHDDMPGSALGVHFASILKMRISPNVLQEVRADLWRKREEEEEAVRRREIMLEAEQRRRQEEQRGRELQELVQKMTAGAGLPWAPASAAPPRAQAAPIPVSTRDPRARTSPLAPSLPGELRRNELGVGAERAAADAASMPDDSGLSRSVLEKLSMLLEDGRVYQLVARLRSEQATREKDLFEQRKLLRHQHDKRKKLAQALTGPEDALQQEEKEMEGEMRDLDMKVISELDSLLQTQQRLLETLNVPGFFPTMDPTQLEIQAKVMSVILNKPPAA